MKKILVSFLVLIILPITKAKADCTDSEYYKYQQLALPISLSYTESEKLVDANNNPIKGVYIIHISGLDDNLYLQNKTTKLVISPNLKNNGIISIEGYESGNHVFEVKNNNCSKTIKELKISLPKYNTYANRTECKGVDPNKLALCDKWYPYEINETDFLKRIAQYKNPSKEDTKKEEQSSISKTINKYYTKYQKPIIIALVLIMITIITIIIIKKRKNKLKYPIDLTKIK